MTGRTVALTVGAAVIVACGLLLASLPQPVSAQGRSADKSASEGVLSGTATTGTAGSVIAGFTGPSGSARAIIRTVVSNPGTKAPTLEVAEWATEGGSADAGKAPVRRRVLSKSMVCAVDLRPGEAVRIRCLGDAVVQWELVEFQAGGH